MKLAHGLIGLGVVLGGAIAGPYLYRALRPQWIGDPMAAAPRTFLWAWQRPEDLRFLPQGRYGVALLAGTITLEADQTIFAPRRQPLMLPPKPYLMAVVRIEARHPSLTAGQRKEAVEHLLFASREPFLRALQIDFDATASQRPFYVALLKEIRSRMRPEQRLSMTALASWCIHDTWIKDLPVDEAVPMLFRMGPDESSVRQFLDARNEFGPKICQYSVGVSTDEPTPRLPAARRIYLFHPQAFTAQAISSWESRQ